MTLDAPDSPPRGAAPDVRRRRRGAPRRRLRLPPLPHPRTARRAEDLTSATFEKALRLWSRFDPRRGTARTWLLGIARTTALDWFRAESRRRRREEAAAPPDRVEASFVEGLSPALEAALATLSAGEREVLALRVVLELDGDATARVLGISPTAVSTRLSRALKRLEERMRTEDDLG